MVNGTENVADQIQQQEVNVQAQEADASKTVQNQTAQEAQSQGGKEYNFAQLRKSKEQLEQRVGELEGYLKKMMESQKSSAPPESKEDDFGIGDEELAEGKHLKKVYNELKNLRNQIYQEKMASIPDLLKARFNDFDQVVTKENVEKFKQTEPELYSSITAGSDLYAKGIAAYKAIKALGYTKETYSEQKEQVQANHSRPVSAQAIKGQGALSEKNVFAGGLTPELKKQLQSEMAEAVKAR